MFVQLQTLYVVIFKNFLGNFWKMDSVLMPNDIIPEMRGEHSTMETRTKVTILLSIVNKKKHWKVKNIKAALGFFLPHKCPQSYSFFGRMTKNDSAVQPFSSISDHLTP